MKTRLQQHKMADKWERKCKTWLNEDGSLYSRTDVAPAPIKDFLQIYVTTAELTLKSLDHDTALSETRSFNAVRVEINVRVSHCLPYTPLTLEEYIAVQVIFRIWKIIPPTRADASQQPTQITCLYSEFAEDERLRAMIARNMGEREITYIDRLIAGHIDYLNRLPRKVLLRIIFNLDLVSIARLAQVNRLFRELCSCDALWSKLYLQHTTQPITQDLLMLSDTKGWKELFFMNKLQLQMLLKRQNEKAPKDKRFAFADKFSKGGGSRGATTQ